MFRAVCLPAPVSVPDGRMPLRAREPRPFSQSRTTCRIPGTSSRLGRDLAFRVRNSPRSCATSLLGRDWPEQGPCLGGGQKCASCLPAALSSVQTLQKSAFLPRRDDAQESQCFAGGKASILPSKDDVQDGVDQRPGLGELRPSEGNISRACARRPGLGEILEQSPGLGELWASVAREAARGTLALPAGCPFRGPKCSKMQIISLLRLCMRYSVCMNARLPRNGICRKALTPFWPPAND